MKKKSAPPRTYIKNKSFSYLLNVIVFSAIYFAAAIFGLSLDPVNKFATLVWIPSGIAVAALLLFGKGLWLGVAIGAFLANFVNGAPLLVAMGIAAGNTLEALTCVFLLKRKGFKNSFNHLRDVYLFILTAVPQSGAISATIGVTSLLLGGVISLSSFYITWITWLMGDVISILIITPFILTWAKYPRVKLSIKKVIEVGTLSLLLILVGLIIFFPTTVEYPITYLAFLPLIWASFRFGQHGATAAVLALSIMAVLGTVLGLTPFSTGRLSIDLLSVQGFMGIITSTSLILAAGVAERLELEKRKDEFIAIASHELKTPVTSIKLYTQLLHRKFQKLKDVKSADSIAKMDTQVNKLSALINDLLDVTKIEEGKLQFNFEVFDLSELIDEISEEMQLTTKHNIEKKLKQGNLVEADRERIGQVITNIISNAIKYSPEANRIIVTSSRRDSTAQVSIKDFGAGLSENDQKKVFDRFNRARQDAKGGLPGLGLGLYISREIIKRHKGQIWLESRKGRGTTFHFSLPLKNIS